MDIDTLLATRVRELRRARGLTLEQLAAASGVSRSMISLIERQETSPTAAVLDRLAVALGLTLPALFAAEVPRAAPEPLARHADQAQWTDPASGYRRRHLTPAGVDAPLELVEVEFPPGQTVVFEHPVRRSGLHQQLWLIAGAMDITVQDRTWQLDTGDCLAMAPGARITFHNPGSTPARYVLALASDPHPSRSTA